ncbi:MAG: phosphate ABC transporter substrate-binding protein PstS, partial [Acidimicrobiales bacterium]
MKRFVVFATIAGLALAGCGSSPSTSSGSTTTVTLPTTSVPVQTGNPTAPITINEDGSSLLYPFLNQMPAPIQAAYSNITFAPAAGGSGKGISDAIAGNVQMGGSDAYLSPAQFTANPGLANIPVAVSYQAVNYNLPGVASGLKLSGSVIAKMYEGTITMWNDAAITALNPGVTLPATPVVTVHRSDSSGDTFIFTSFLSAVDTSVWGGANGPGRGTTVTWPASDTVSASGNPGMVQTCQTTPGCIAYIGISAENTATGGTPALGQAMLQNASGSFVAPTPTTAAAAVTALGSNIPANLAAPIIYETGAQAYPITNFEYLVVKDTQPDANTAEAIRDVLSFLISPTGGSAPALLAN